MECSRFEIGGRQMLLQERPSIDCNGGKVWNASKVLARYLEENKRKKPVAGKRILELGSGCGLLGISLGLLGANVTLSEQPIMLEILNSNVRYHSHMAEEASGKLQVVECDWLDPPELRSDPAPYWDMIVATDVVYIHALVPPLVNLLSSLASMRTHIYIAIEMRDREVHQAFEAECRKHFTVSRISNAKLPKDVQDDQTFVYLMRKSNRDSNVSGVGAAEE
eukprot:GILJ01008025.1.p1 GENE.GILJ01008025.1~~GILJ01008025.1.p1  ORF type:complete len:222 (-),score=24.29 GILJ01008025.1:227-892(-)